MMLKSVLYSTGDSAYEIHSNFTWTVDTDKYNTDKVLKTFEEYFKPAQHNNQFKTQSEFMIRLWDIICECIFENSDEIVIFPFLTVVFASREQNLA